MCGIWMAWSVLRKHQQLGLCTQHANVLPQLWARQSAGTSALAQSDDGVCDRAAHELDGFAALGVPLARAQNPRPRVIGAWG